VGKLKQGVESVDRKTATDSRIHSKAWEKLQKVLKKGDKTSKKTKKSKKVQKNLKKFRKT
jgi:hypothetical protein